MNVSAVFDLLDLNHDGELSRSELHVAAKRLKWHWNEAPLFALIELFSVPAPILKLNACTMKRFSDGLIVVS